ncbi:MAG: T9SS type A sorting domain-containing protein [Labilibaculum sp.]|nr:T9SS type A sorting domain-containing protein [Labilibaculum sp.]
MKQIYSILISLLFLVLTSNVSNAQNLLFAQRAGSDQPPGEGDKGHCITADEDGFIYIAGTMEKGSTGAIFGENQVNETVIPNSGAFLSKFKNNGDLLWIKQIGGNLNSNANAYCIFIDKEKNIFVSGTFYDQTIFGLGETNETTLFGNKGEIFFAKYDQNGQLIWAKSIGGDEDDNPGGKDLIVDVSGNIYITGGYSGEVTFGEGELNETTITGGISDIFLAKFNPTGILVWVKCAKSNYANASNALDLDNDCNIYLTGIYYNNATFEKGLPNETTLNNNNVSAFIAKYNNNGDLIWAISPFISEYSDVGYDIKVNNEGDILFAGYFTNTITLGEGTPNKMQLTSSGDEDILLAKYSSEGNFIWAKTAIGSTGGDRIYSIDTDNYSNIFLTGYYSDNITFGTNERNTSTLFNLGSSDLFLAKLSSNGEFIWATSSGGEGWEQGSSVTVDELGNSFITGFYSGNAALGMNETNETTLNNFGGTDILIAKFEYSFNASPEFICEGDLTVPEDFEDSKQITIKLVNTPVGEEDQIISYSIEPQNSDFFDFSFDETTGCISFTSLEEKSGEQVFVITADDGQKENYLYTHEFTVSVQPVNDLPLITGIINEYTTLEDSSLYIPLSDINLIDPDNLFPEDYNVVIGSGRNYTCHDSTILPNEDFYGVLTVSVMVNDGIDNSEPYMISINVAPVNDTPEITGTVNKLSTPEETSLKISLDDLVIDDPDNIFPDNFTYNIGEGTNYNLQDTTITPDGDFNGNLIVPVTVNDGVAESSIFNLVIEVTPVNDLPVITGVTKTFETYEDEPLKISLTDLAVNDPDNTYPDDFTLSIQSGEFYSVNEHTITPDNNYYGNIEVPIVVNDGLENSEAFTISINVIAVNDIPVITGINKESTTIEDVSFNISVSDLLISDPDNTFPDDFSLSIGEGLNYIVTANLITPDTNFHGNLNVPIVVNDGIANSDEFIITLEVSSVNDAPIIASITKNCTTPEETSFGLLLSDFIVTDPDNTYPDNFNLIIEEGINYTVQNNVITPNLDFNGNLSVPVIVNDGISNSPEFITNIKITAVNDVPVISGTYSTFETLEDKSIAILLTDLIVIDPDNTYPDDYTLTITSGDNFSLQGHTITPNQEFSGVLNISLTINDGFDNSNKFQTTINVVDVNDIPEITGVKKDCKIKEDAPFSISLTDILVIDPDNIYPDDFTLIIKEGINYTVQENTIIPTADFYGFLNVPLLVNDGDNNSQEYIINLEVISVNDVPVITGTTKDFLTKEEASLNITLTDFTVYDPDNTFPQDYTLIIGSGANYGINLSSVTPNINFFGNIVVTVKVSDGELESEEYQITITVDKALGIDNNFVEENFTIYPNPVKNQLHIQHRNFMEPYELKIFSFNGQLIYSSDDSQKNQTEVIDFSAISSGTYLLQIITKNGSGAKRIIKIK